MTDQGFQQASVASATYPCGGCGARLEFAPGSTSMQCPYCGFRQEIAAGDREIREIAIELIEAVLERGQCDFVRDFSGRFPTIVFLEFMGLPLDQQDKFLDWNSKAMHGGPTPDDPTGAQQATAAKTAAASQVGIIAWQKPDQSAHLESGKSC